ncbi:Hypothetical predicted protein [Olea europaea subsp. europaea]|uniref:Uncharacterized protein n=1 Tax=Olea europaea subsp. europaea TaxID=158383 RepID=A0A8S0TJH3_OLEEU|nr:Hypothetical predicted protein [Olea europaea subsp. europaea]
MIEISYNEEASVGETRKKGCDEGWDVEDQVWLSKLLAKVEVNENDSDDILVVREAILNPKESNILPLKPITKIEDSDVDDCVIVDGDSDKLFAVEADNELCICW